MQCHLLLSLSCMSKSSYTLIDKRNVNVSNFVMVLFLQQSSGLGWPVRIISRDETTFHILCCRPQTRRLCRGSRTIRKLTSNKSSHSRLFWGNLKCAFSVCTRVSLGMSTHKLPYSLKFSRIKYLADLPNPAQKQIFTDKIFVVESCINHAQPITAAQRTLNSWQ